jgi:hypothetical protein
MILWWAPRKHGPWSLGPDCLPTSPWASERDHIRSAVVNSRLPDRILDRSCSFGASVGAPDMLVGVGGR